MELTSSRPEPQNLILPHPFFERGRFCNGNGQWAGQRGGFNFLGITAFACCTVDPNTQKRSAETLPTSIYQDRDKPFTMAIRH